MGESSESIGAVEGVAVSIISLKTRLISESREECNGELTCVWLGNSLTRDTAHPYRLGG